ncbi:hypothetical protein BDY21DRAFT_361051 [Lineolata rhizophorae]|uniref:Uncharacterized protein n=1 Tax=Lineolata rhizophorae TaxID=578093 RepID=A0A6A6PB44_9PEZI|nr:hypothetical protein BDY21DRAFT_361051 [Lineolata rhizophorae]
MPISLLHPDTTDIFYETTPDDDEVLIAGSDDDYDEIQRAAKQRRVEEYGQRYLRGERLFIQTAGLRGPFEGKWRNPWRRVKDTKHTGNGSKEVLHASIRKTSLVLRMSFQATGQAQAGSPDKPSRQPPHKFQRESTRVH